jgi:tRNA threonylcarbamoyl adenosine modification protein YjeE
MPTPDATYSQDELEHAARELGRSLRPGDVVLLFGPMGAGKTTFTRALAHGLGVARPERVCSPTFNLLLVHAGPVPLVHADLCRLGELGSDAAPSISSAAFEALGLGELADARRVLVVEWAEYWADPPADRLELRLSAPADVPDRRGLAVIPHGARATRLAANWRGVGSARGV